MGARLGAPPQSRATGRFKMKRVAVLAIIGAVATAALDVRSPALAEETGAPPPHIDEAAAQLLRGDVAKSVAMYTAALKDTGIASDRRAAILNDRGVANLRLGETRAALDDYNRAIELFPEYPIAYNNRGNLLLAIGQVGEATKDFDRALILAPKYAAAYSNRGNARMRLGRPVDAMGDFTKAIELMPGSAPPLSGRGIAYLAAGKPHAAIRDFSRAVSADARFASAYRNRGEARMAIGQRDEAIEDLSRALAFDASNSELYVVRGYAYLLNADVASAIKDFSRAIELDPKASAAYEGRGLANVVAEAPDDAYSDLNKAIGLNPRSAVAFAFRAYVYKETNQPDIGAKDVETALRIDANSPEALWARGEIEEASGQADSAIADLRRALQLRPSWQFASDALKRLGAASDAAETQSVPELGIERWHVVLTGKDYAATSDDYPQVRVPLEMIGEGAPKLIAWEVQKPPYANYGILRFSGGQVTSKAGTEDTELAAIIDIVGAKVLAIEPNRQGTRLASWTWGGDRVQIASVDGVTDEYQVRPGNVPVAGNRDYSDRQERRRYRPKSFFEFLFGN
jgi:tetratricopeptide (TPR) repeat protein